MFGHRLRVPVALAAVLALAAACGSTPSSPSPPASTSPAASAPVASPSAIASLAPASAGVSGAPASALPEGQPLPGRVFAPYFEGWTSDTMTAVATSSGVRYFSMAFLQAAAVGSCALTWNGDAAATMSAGLYAVDLAGLRNLGGDMIPSFGGYTADNTATEIADSCPSVPDIAAAYESVITEYGVTRLDMDIEDNSLGNAAGIERRSQAIKLLEDWAVQNNRPLQISYTLPTGSDGLGSDGIGVLRSAIDAGARVDVVNIMTFDYYDGTTNMAAAATAALTALHGQLATLYPSKSAGDIWAMEATTIMVGIDDLPGKTEVTQVADATRVLDFARSKGMSMLSFWAIQRDNGACVGTAGDDKCSGVAQKPWEFSQALAGFTAK